mgnify:CR=1 FL=1
MEIYYRRTEGANETRVRVLRYDEAQAKSEFDRQCYLLSAICHYQREEYDENLLSLNLALQITQHLLFLQCENLLMML